MDVTHQNEQENRKIVPFFRSGDYFFHRGIVAYRKNHLQRAVKLFERAVKLTEKEPVFHVQLAAVLSELGEYDRSNDILTTILKEQGDGQAECYFFMANNYAYLGLFERAETAVERYLKLCPDDEFTDDARDLLELLQFERGDQEDWDEFEEESEELIIDHEKARTLLSKGEIKAAIPVLQSIIETYPTCWAAHNHLAEAYYRDGNEKAFDVCEEVLKNDPGNLFAICNLALFYSMGGDTEQAARFIAALRYVYPLDVDHHVKVAQVLCAVGDYQQTFERLKVVEGYILDNRPELLFCLGMALFHKNQVEKAEQYWKRAGGHGHILAKKYVKQSRQGCLDKNSLKYHIWERNDM
ncbi:tetratricopeptide repeat protein [Bacillus solitudinis]|uniref:tetratricopeptide repeat protein n=1 Tax=Bacillus solitudinis TaxID=2014074 RepID=UPI000C24B231|nr:tetratricopeptide repeat protein [Bacillus solitudinis]